MRCDIGDGGIDQSIACAHTEEARVVPACLQELFKVGVTGTSHAATGVEGASAAGFDQFLQARWCDTRFLCVRDGDRLVAAAVTDVTPIGFSAVYTFFDPDLATRSLGVFSILQQIAWAERLGLPHVYLGYWLDGHAKMSYKQHYQPREILEQGQWKRVDAP